ACDRGDTDDPAVLVDESGLQQLPGDPHGSGQVDRDHRLPAVLGHVRELLVAGDAGVVHPDVDTTMVLPDVVGDALGGVGVRDVQGQAVPVDLLHHRLQLAGGLGHVDAEDRGPVAVQHPGDLFPDPAAG